MGKHGENIRKRKDGRWEARVISAYDLCGKAKYRSFYGKTYLEAKEKRNNYIRNSSGSPHGKYADIPNNKKITVNQVMWEWMEFRKEYVKESTFAHYKNLLERHILPVFGNVYLSALTSEMINAFLMKKKLSAFSLRDNFFPVILENGLFEFSCRQLESADAEKAAYFLKVLENSRHPLFKEKVSQLLLSPLPSVRLKALQTVERCSLYSKKEQVVEMVENDSAALVRREALSTLISLTEEEEISLLAEKYLPQEEMKSGVLQGFLKKDTDKAAQALYFLNEMAFSPNAAQRFEACRIMCSGPSKQGYPLARKLCQDGDLSVRKKAFELAGKMRSVRLVPFLIDALQDEDTKSAAFDALLKAGPTAYAPVKSALKDSRFSFDVKRELVLFLALSDKDACADVFSHLLPLVSLKVQREIYIQMRKIEKECGVALPRAPLLKSIFQNLKGLEFIFIQKMELAERRNSFSKEEAEAFSLQLKEFKKILRDNVLDGFYFMYSLKVFRRAVKALMEEKKEEFAASFGIMEDVLPEKYVRQALPLLKESFSPDRDG